jgi:hypothetical protein
MMVGGTPNTAGAPAFVGAAYRAAARAFFDPADAVNRFTGGLETVRNDVCLIGCDYRDHPNAAVKGAGKFAGLNGAACL